MRSLTAVGKHNGILESTQTEQAFLAIAQGNPPKEATVNILKYKDMEPSFVKGETDEPATAASRTNEISYKSVKVEMMVRKSPDPIKLHSLADLSVFLVP